MADYGLMRLGLVLVLLSSFAGSGLTGSNAVPSAAAGAGSGAISGYTVSSISYTLDGGTIDTVSFELSPPAARTVKARLAPGEPWTACAVAGAAVSCPVGTSAAAAGSLDVVAG